MDTCISVQYFLTVAISYKESSITSGPVYSHDTAHLQVGLEYYGDMYIKLMSIVNE